MSEDNFNSYYGSDYNSDLSAGSDNSQDNYYYDKSAFAQESALKLSQVELESNVLAQSFIFMFVALIITGITSYLTLVSGLYLSLIWNDTLFYGCLIAELVVVFAANSTVRKNQLVPSALLFVAYSIINGITLSVIFLAYTASSIASVFILAAVLFGAMALYGITTKQDLSKVGNICLMALLGIIIVSLANILFLHLEGLELALSFIGVLLFVGITAYDTQKLKAMTYAASTDNATVLALYGALQLYLDFINIFLKLLSLFGRKRNN